MPNKKRDYVPYGFLGLVVYSLVLVLASWSFLIIALFSTSAHAASFSVKTYIPPQAFQYFPIIKKEVQLYLPDNQAPSYVAALLEHESCISLRHSRCWNPTSRLKTAREEGAGLAQLTRAYYKNGSLRFDIIADLKQRNKEALKELSWSNVYQRPDLQIRAAAILLGNNYKSLYSIKNLEHRLHFTDAAYNGGLGGVLKERQACGLKAKCDPQKWFGHVEHVCLKSKKALYGVRSACDINRHHVKDVFYNRRPKFEPYF